MFINSTNTLSKSSKISKFLTPEERLECYEMIEQGRQNPNFKEAQTARVKMSDSYSPMVINLAKKYKIDGYELSDLVNEGSVELLRSIDKYTYDPEIGDVFTTYAQSRIWVKFSNLFQKNSKEIKSDSIDDSSFLEGQSTLNNYLTDKNDLNNAPLKKLLKEDISKVLEKLPLPEKTFLIMSLGLNDIAAKKPSYIKQRFHLTDEEMTQVQEIKNNGLKLIKEQSREALSPYLIKDSKINEPQLPEINIDKDLYKKIEKKIMLRPFSANVNRIITEDANTKSRLKLSKLDRQFLVERLKANDNITYLNNLTPLEQKVIKTRYGLEDGIFKTLERTGKIIDGYTKESMRRIEEGALAKLAKLIK